MEDALFFVKTSACVSLFFASSALVSVAGCKSRKFNSASSENKPLNTNNADLQKKSGLSNFVSFKVKEDEFVELPENFVFEHQIEEVEEHVKRIESIFTEHFNIQASVEQTLIEVFNSPVNGDYSYHKIKFGKLTEDQFKKLDEYYQFPIGEPIKRVYDATKVYSIQDFLVPKIQSVAGKTMYGRFKPLSISSTPYDGEGVAYMPNCWTTVHDVLTSDRAPMELNGIIHDFENNGVFFIELFKNQKYFKPLSAPERKDIKAYDVFADVKSEEFGLQHAGVFIAPGLVFEKTGPGAERYRIRAMAREDLQRDSFRFYRLTQPLLLPSELPQLSKNNKWKIANPIRVTLDKGTGLFAPDPAFVNSKAVGQYAPLRTCPRTEAEEGLCDTFGYRQNFLVDELEEP